MVLSIPHTGTAEALWALDHGSLTYDASLVVLGGSGVTDHPITSFLIKHERGLVLFDTGLDPNAADRQVEEYGELASAFNMRFATENRVDRQIEKMGFSVDDVTHVVVSHAHFDHTGGLKLFPNAKLYMGLADLRFVFWPDGGAAGSARWPDIEATRTYHWNPVQGDLDLFGDGSMVMISLPGHTPGSAGMIVRLPNETLILTGDAVHLRANIEWTMPMGGDHNTSDATNSIRRLQQLRDSFDAKIWIAHDPEDWVAFGGAGRYGA